jgi:cell shape-determining protein MreC
MMNSYRPNNSRRSLWAATALVVFILVIDIFSGGKVRNEARAVGSFFSFALFHAASSVGGSGFFSSRASLEAQNRALVSQVNLYEERAAGFAVLQTENEQLRALTHLAQTTPGISAPVVSSVISSPYGTFLIGAGTGDGIVRGSEVLTSGGFVVGTVSDVGAHTSTVSETFAPGASVKAVIRGTPVSIAGSGGGNAQTSVPRNVLVLSGDSVISPELGQRPIGVVGEVSSSTAQASQTIYIRLPVSLGALQFVYVVSP